ncbi:MAG TPA: hypothetical protein VHG91_02900 [Longimicrobium sp.]|nr:hypothetical protein [Longimicrobium sp.]
MKKLKLEVETLKVEQFETESSIEIEGTVHAASGWYSDPCRFCLPYAISETPNSC